ncbi:MAG: ABC transporter permease [Acidobacteria bacterium]|nr:ABC transporter permease [Acidobacteriota bacterium]
MLTFCLRRILMAALLVLAVASGALVLTRLAPGDGIEEGHLLDPVARAAERARLGLDRPLAEQYVAWLAGAVRLDFGESVLYSRPVTHMVGERAVNTAILAVAALALATLLGIPLGVYTGTHASGIGAALARGASTLLLSIPPLVGALVLVLVAARTGWFPAGGMTSVGGSATWAAWVADVLSHLPVPALSLSLPLAATLERLQSQALAEAAREPFVDASRARGVPPRQVLARHAWPASLGPVLAVYGLMIGSLFSGSFVVEVITAWPGLGRLMFDALRARDLYLVAGTAAAGAACLAAGTLAADVVHARLDPRVRERHRP